MQVNECDWRNFFREDMLVNESGTIGGEGKIVYIVK